MGRDALLVLSYCNREVIFGCGSGIYSDSNNPKSNLDL